MKLIPGAGRGQDEAHLRQAAWVARCVGRGASAPLSPTDVSVLADVLRERHFARGAVVFEAGSDPDGVWIVRHGQVELAVGSGRKRAVIAVLRPGDVDGDIPLLLDMMMPYAARTLTEATCLFLSRTDFEGLVATHPAIARRWLSSVAGRLSTSQARILGLLGRSLPAQLAQLLLDEQADGSVPLTQHTLAAMLGVRRPSLNKILKEFERDELISIRYAAIDLVDPGALARRAR